MKSMPKSHNALNNLKFTGALPPTKQNIRIFAHRAKAGCASEVMRIFALPLPL
ncbi:hypothetical protein BACEGG_00287 [Bacteroides eggerthii DSM 20697]|uniref:Uncharacterized protein n=1 Tax=Bacteroides eggerthii 1_2_48FAA TaxID=665953 RepID=E5WYL1_9BACE|nr:hypothetical protein BACEGG_00287 [Bacteroides eggerthii DSM 20697]EFV30020.1 hypothetical protein HMPREF1016_01743 [Bacteroides eggerthii 1_2_48FAA]